MGTHDLALHRRWAADLSPAELYSLLQLRSSVFVQEQASPYPELDGRDLEDGARHVWLAPEGQRSRVTACLRLLDESEREMRIGRLCVARAERGNGHARRLLEAALAEVAGGAVLLTGQTQLVPFYEQFGFRVAGDPFDDYGVAHVPMRRAAGS